MVAVPGNKHSRRRYRRRILGWGAAALLVVFGVGSAVTVSRVEDDLRSRVADAFDDAGFAGVTVSFSGQDGTVACDRPLDDPARARAVGSAQRGVRTLELEPGCTRGDGAAGGAPAEEAGEPEPVPEPPPTATTSVVETVETTSPSTSSTTTLPDPTTVLDIIVEDPQFSVLKNAVETVDLGEQLGGSGPITVFAPTDDAFAALGPNFNAALASDPEALASVLRHHIVARQILAGDLVDGPLTMVDGTTVDVDTSPGPRVTSADVTATVIDADLDAANGTVHVIDQVLLPAGLDLGVTADVFTFVARYEDGRVVLSGRVRDEGQRGQLLAAVVGRLAPDNVVDELVVDSEVPFADADAEALVQIIPILPRDLVRGEVILADDGIFVSGIYVTSASIESAAAAYGAVTGLNERPAATETSAAAMEERLNATVADEPIRFAPASAELAPETAAVLDRLAARAKALRGVRITVEGHTDSDGSVEVNLALSQARADAVVTALVQRGVLRDDLSAVGRGAADPVLVDGVEDKAASRRVGFIVERE